MKTLDASKSDLTFPIALVVSRFNVEITSRLLDGAVRRLRERGFAEEQITVVHVPGAVEIPIVTQRLCQTKQFACVVALGAVIRGETTHYDYVCEQVSQGCQQLALENSTPVIFGVLTTENEAQAFDRVGGQHGHKGQDAVDAAVETVAVLRQIS